MNLALFGETAEEAERHSPPSTAVEISSPVHALAARFKESLQRDGSCVRAVRHQPARAARYADFLATPHSRAAHGEVRVKRQIVGFKKIKFYTLENIGAGVLSLPEQEIHTTAFWLQFCVGFFDEFAGYSRSDLQDALLALANVLQIVATVILLSDARDIGVAVLDDSEQMQSEFEPDVVLYDNYPGGIGQKRSFVPPPCRIVAGRVGLSDVL